MKNLKTYLQLFENIQELTPEQIEWLDSCTKGTWTLNPRTGLVDVNGNLYCYKQGLTDFKGVKFGVVSKDFYCNNNQLTSLDGAPQEVGGSFYCENNQLTSLEGAPKVVLVDYSCYNNHLTSLAGAPQRIGRDFRCYGNNLTSLEGAPQEVGWSFHCEYNQLTSLEGLPQKVRGYFICGGNPVSEDTLKIIFVLMKRGESYIQAVESRWSEFPLEDQILLYRPEFGWVGPEERKKLELVRSYQGFKGML